MEPIGRHRRPPGPQERRRTTLVSALAAVGVAAAVGTAFLRMRDDGDDFREAGATVSDEAGSTAASRASATDRREPCSDSVVLSVPTAYTSAFGDIVARFETTNGQRNCSPVQIVPATSGSNIEQLVSSRVPALYLARTQAEVAALPQDRVTGDSPVVATSPLVVGLPQPMAAKLGWPGKPLDTAAWRGLVTGKTTWSGLGHPEWGTFNVAMPDPAQSATGAAAFGALVSLANGGLVTAPPDYAQPSEADLSVIKVEHTVGTLARDEVSVLPDRAMPIDEAARRGTAYVTTEKAIADHNADNPKTPLVATPVAAGMAAVDLRLVRLGEEETDSARAETASRFAEFLSSAEGIVAIRAAGLRGPDGSAPTDRPSGIRYAAAPLKPIIMTGEQMGQAVGMWGVMHARISSFALIDASGSMNERLGSSDRSKLDVVRGVVGTAYQVASPKARSGVWFFHTQPDLTALVTRATPLERNNAVRGGVLHMQRVTTALNKVRAGGGTPLYQAVQEAYGSP